MLDTEPEIDDSGGGGSKGKHYISSKEAVFCIFKWLQCPIFNEFKSRLKFLKNRFQLSAGFNLKKLNSILSGTTIFEPRLKFFQFGLSPYTGECPIHNGI